MHNDLFVVVGRNMLSFYLSHGFGKTYDTGFIEPFDLIKSSLTPIDLAST